MKVDRFKDTYAILKNSGMIKTFQCFHISKIIVNIRIPQRVTKIRPSLQPSPAQGVEPTF